MRGEKNNLPSPGADFKYLIPDNIEENKEYSSCRILIIRILFLYQKPTKKKDKFGNTILSLAQGVNKRITIILIL